MSKIKINDDDTFSPWEESFITFDNSYISDTKLTPIKKQFFLIDHKRSQTQRKSKRQKILFPRSYVKINHVNLEQNQQNKLSLNSQCKNDAKKYKGPRISFYCKMNPRCLKSPKISLSRLKMPISENSSLFTSNSSVAKQARNESKAYKTIQPKCKDQNMLQSHPSRQTMIFNSSKLPQYSARKMKEQHQIMKRLKVLYTLRKVTNY